MPKLPPDVAAEVAEEGGAIVRVWYAKFPSDCAYGDRIATDDAVVWIDNEVAHAACAEYAGAELRW
jgi:hypothetical protein